MMSFRWLSYALVPLLVGSGAIVAPTRGAAGAQVQRERLALTSFISASGELVLRGGYWHAPPDFLAKEYRGVIDPSPVDDTGFRLVRRLR